MPPCSSVSPARYPQPRPTGRRRRGRRPEGFGRCPNPRRRGNSLAPSRSNPPRPQHPRKAALSRGPPTSWIEKSAATPRIWVEAANSSLPCPRIAWGPRQRDGVGTPPQAFWGNAPKPWRRADSLRPSRSNPERGSPQNPKILWGGQEKDAYVGNRAAAYRSLHGRAEAG